MLERRRGSTVTSRIREREAEFTKQVKEREEQISRLKERLKLLSKKLADSKDNGTKEFKFPRDTDVMEHDQREDGAELQHIIRQVTKERLQLERHLQIANDSLQRNNGVDLTKYLSLEQTNSHLRQQLDSLDLLQQEHKLVEIQYREKEEACRELVNTLKYKSALCDDLETQLAKVIEKNTELTIANSDLQKKVLELKDVNEECQSLKSTLTKVETECVTAKTEVNSLTGKVRNLESVLDEMHRAAENRREIERQHREALENLKRKQDEVETTATKKQEEFINQLKLRIDELENEKRAQNERHQELILEMAEIKKYGGGTSLNGSIASDIEQPSDNLEIDEIMAKLEQDNKFLADLERQRERNAAKSQLSSTSGSNNNSKQPSPSSGVDSDTTNSPQSTKNHSPTSSSTLNRTGSAITDSGFLSQSSLNGSGGSPTSHGSHGNNGLLAMKKPSSSMSSSLNSGNTLNKLPGLTGADKINLLNGHSFSSNPNIGAGATQDLINRTEINKDGMIEIPGKGWCFVYVAQYSYDPFQHSPNDSPEAELQVNAGDYILVWGEVDEDGFFDGELLDGRRGLVPSNFVGRLENEDLIDFHQQVVLGLGDCDDSVCTSIPQDLDIISSDEGVEDSNYPRISRKSKSYLNHNSNISSNATSSHSQPLSAPIRKSSLTLPQYASCTDLEMTEDEGDGPARDNTTKVPPPPKQLTLETQHNKSLVIAWNPPDDLPVNKIESYEVLVDGVVHSSIKASNNSSLKVTVNALDLSKIHRFSVKTVAIGGHGLKSHEAACTMVLGKDAPLGPTAVRATRITSTAATISWIPSNTNFLHSIAVNGVDVKTVRPGVFRHTLAGLAPNTLYRVTIRAKNLKAAPYIAASADYNQLHNLSSSIEIRTAPKGLPDAPLQVVVDSGPRLGTIVVSWLPVTINPSGTSNGAPVTGYIVYGDGRRLMDVESGTADQAVVDLGTREDIKYITVRTKSGKDAMSSESDRVMVPPDIIGRVDSDTESEGEIIERLRKDQMQLDKVHAQLDQNSIINSGQIVDVTNSNAYAQLQQPREVLINYTSGYPELDSDIGPSELSDIAEEPEEGLTDTDSDQSTPRPSIATQQHNNINYQRKSSLQNSLSQLQSSMSMTSNSFRKQQESNVNSNSSTDSKVPTSSSNASLPEASQQDQAAKASLNRWNKTGSSPNLVMSASQFQAQPLFPSVPPANTVSSASNNHQSSPSISTSSISSVISNNAPVAEARKESKLPSSQTTSSIPSLPEKPKTNSTSTVHITHDDISSEIIPQNKSKSVEVKSDVNVTVKSVNQRNVTSDKNGYVSIGAKPAQIIPATSSSNKRAVRIFVALFDYDPLTMSPNPDACEEELPFREGQLIKVHGDKDADGFYWGEAGNRSGFVPCNMVSEVQVEDDRVAEELFREQSEPTRGVIPSSLSNGSSAMIGTKSSAFEADDRWGDIYEDMPAKRKLALYDYDPTELSPNVDAEVELSFRTGDMLLVYGDMDDDGFYMGELNGRRGLVPSNFLTDVPPGYVVVEQAAPSNRFTSASVPQNSNSMNSSKGPSMSNRVNKVPLNTVNNTSTIIKSTNYVHTTAANSTQNQAMNYGERNQSQPIPSARSQQPKNNQRRW